MGRKATDYWALLMHNKQKSMLTESRHFVMGTILHEWRTYVTDRIARRQIRLARERFLAELRRRKRALGELPFQSARLPILPPRPHPPDNAGCRPRRRRCFRQRHADPTVERDEPNSCGGTPRGDAKKNEGMRFPQCAPQRLVTRLLYDATPCFWLRVISSARAQARFVAESPRSDRADHAPNRSLPTIAPQR